MVGCLPIIGIAFYTQTKLMLMATSKARRNPKHDS